MRWMALLMSLAFAGAASAETQVPVSEFQVKLSYAPVVKSVVPSVVNIYAQKVIEAQRSPFANDPFFSEFFGQLRGRARVENALGSGVILGDGGIVVSNYHVVGGATDIRVVLADRREFDADLVFADPETDLAVLKMRDAPDLPVLGFADSDAIEVGDLVLAVGNPFGVGQTVSSGIISARARTGHVRGKPGYFIQTDAPINPGNSGGALVDMEGRLVGINTAIVTRSGGSNGIGFAIPANLVRQYVEQAMAGATELERPWAGITVQTVDGALADALGLMIPRGVLINDLHEASPFSDAGLEIGDIVVSVEGLPVDGGPEMLFRLLTLGVGQVAEVTFIREEQVQMAFVSIISAPENLQADQVTILERSALQGLTIANIDPALMAQFGLPLNASGVVVTDLDGRSERSRLRPGDIIERINGVDVRDVSDITAAISEQPRRIAMRLVRGNQRIFLRFSNR